MGGASLASGTVVGGRYAIVRALSAGGMGTVHEATHLFTKKRVALKTMLPSIDADPKMSADFEREMSVTAAIECPHLVQVLDAGIDGEMRFIVMELLEGENLGEMLRRRGRLPADEVVALLAQVAVALDATHAQGIVHRDLKPENLFLTRLRGKPHLKVLDFGIARAVSNEATLTRCIGTPLYMSPEQLSLEARLTAAVDRYALGQIAFTLLVGVEYWHPVDTGIHPFTLALEISKGITTAATGRATAHGVELPHEIDAWFARACAKTATDRFASAAQMIEALADALGTSFPQPMSSLPDPRRARTSEAMPAASPMPSGVTPSGAELTAPTMLVTPVPERAHTTDAPSRPQGSVFDRLVDVLTPFTTRIEAEHDVRRAVLKVCGLTPDPGRLEYVIEELMAGFPRKCVSTRAEMCIALVSFCERERKSRSERWTGTGPTPPGRVRPSG